MLEEDEEQMLKENNLLSNFNFSTLALLSYAIHNILLAQFLLMNILVSPSIFKGIEIIILIRDLGFLIIKIIEVNR